MNWMGAQWEWVKSYFSESYENGVAGKASSQRLIEFLVILAFLIAFLKTTIYLTLLPGMVNLNVIDIPWGWATVILGILGIKTYQKSKVSDNQSPIEPESDVK